MPALPDNHDAHDDGERIRERLPDQHLRLWSWRLSVPRFSARRHPAEPHPI